ncbi:carbohydrate sulfotransferase 3-like [Branchiostoma lanceolatum]|uniref:Sulfotransferase n=1 Tax=Branchiostoma lanceolatum TaxID=7740 RepID=A0A8K0ET93_BRALA|nr:CHST3 [Branchiostoma lanceolatum]
MSLPGTRHFLVCLLSIVVLSIIYFQFRVQHLWESKVSVPSALIFPQGRTANEISPRVKPSNEWPRLNKTANQKKGPKRTTVFIVTQMRSGSSLVGEIFNEHPRCFYYFEPLHSVRYFKDHAYDNKDMQLRMLDGISRCEFGGLDKFLTYYLDTRASHFMGMRSSKMLHRLCRKYNSPKGRACPIPRDVIADRVGGVCRSANVTVVKTIRVDDIRLFRAMAESGQRTGNDVKILHLVRDPRGVTASRLALEFKDDSSFSASKVNVSKVQNLCTWMVRNAQLKHQAKEWLQDRYALVRLEDIAMSPFRMVQKLYAFVGIPPHKAVFRWLKDNTNVTKRIKDPHSPRGNLKETASSWRDRLTLSAVENIQEVCGDAMKLLGYKIVKDKRQLRNNSISLVRKLDAPVIHI